MNRPLLRLLLALLVLVVLAPFGTQAGNKPVVVSHDETYANRAIRFRVAWQSENPVVVVKIFTGRGEQKEIKVDEYDNRRTRDGYSGEVSAIVELDPAFQDEALPFAIQVEDDARLKSDQVRGKVQVVQVKKQDDDWGRERMASQPMGQPMGQTAGGSAVEIIDRVLGLADSYNIPPSLGNITINRVGTDGVSISTRASSNKALAGVNFKIFDTAGTLVQMDSAQMTGKIWQGTSNVMNLMNGNYKVVVQAVDGTGNTSKEKTESFAITSSSLTSQPPMAQIPSYPLPGAGYPGQMPGAQQPAGQWPAAQQPGAQLPPGQLPPVQPPVVQQPGVQQTPDQMQMPGAVQQPQGQLPPAQPPATQ
jgi:hypothetical protein